MADIADASTLVPVPQTAAPVTRGGVSRLWERIALAAVLLLSIFMNFFQLGQGSYGNLYYAAGVRSMTDSLHNFFFVSYDPGGFVTVDKPPVGFWLQAISSKIFGFTPFSIFLPQALCGVLAVLLLYFLVRRHFGVAAGIVAALALAVSPISVVTNRNNTIDSTLALALLLAAWAMIRAAESGKLRWLLLSGVFVGLGFNIKMSEAYLVLPALFMTYLICAPRTWWTRIWHLALFVVVFFALSLSWVVAVDLTPASQRPYVGSTQTNSEVSLAFGYNGLNRLRIGNTGRGGPRPPRATNASTGTTRTGTTGTGAARTGATGSSAQNGAAGRTANTAGRAQGFQGGGNFAEAGAPSIFRLFGISLGGQIAWLLPFAFFGVLALAWQRRFNFQRDRQQLALVLWGFWLLAMAAFFTLDSSFHQYYMTELAPGVSAMVGIGLVTMWGDYRARGWRGWLLPLALVVTAGAQIYMLSSFPAWSSWLTPVIGVLVGLTVLILLVLRIRPSLQVHKSLAQTGVITVALGMLALLIAPTVWSGYSVLRNTESSAPNAGPSFQANASLARTSATTARGANGQAAQNPFAGGFGGDSSTQTNTALISYLEAHQGSTKFLVATASSGNASPIILATNKPVMALGGFGGGDPILTVNELQTLIKNGTVRYFLLAAPRATQAAINQLPPRALAAGRGGFGGFGGGQNNAVTSWVTSNCKVVPASQIQTSGQSLNNNQLYDCAPANG